MRGSDGGRISRPAGEVVDMLPCQADHITMVPACG